MFANLSSILHRSTAPAPTLDASLEPLAAEEHPELDSGAAPSPYTPEHPSRSTQKLSPNSLSASGNQTVTALLSAHPHFSVFRKNHSNSGSFEDMVAQRGADSPLRGEEGRDGRRGGDGEAEEEAMETLATPPASTPARKRPVTSPSADSSGSASFHLSLDGGISLNFGDQSSLSLSPSGSPSAPPSRSSTHSPSPLINLATPDTSHAVSAGFGEGSSVRLVPDSPPSTRTPARSRQTSTASSSTSTASSASVLSRSSSLESSTSRRMRSSAGPVQRVQFSPLSLCPSPLMNAPTMPPPPPLPFLNSPEREVGNWEDGEEKENGNGRRDARGILRPPKTSGTGRSVRFSASTGKKEVGWAVQGEAEEEEEEEGPDDSPSVVPGSRSMRNHSHSQSLSLSHPQPLPTPQAQFAPLPSSTPDSTLDDTDDKEATAHLRTSTSTIVPPARSTSPPASVDGEEASASMVDPSLLVDRHGPENEDEMLFDESNPFWHLHSASASTSGSHSHSHSQSQSQHDAHSRPSSSSASTSASLSQSHALTLPLYDPSQSLLLLDASLGPSPSFALPNNNNNNNNGAGDSFAFVGTGGFGGDSFAQDSYLHRPTGAGVKVGRERLEELLEEEEEEEGEDYSSTSQTPRRLPPRDVQAEVEVEQPQQTSPLRASDMSSNPHSPPHSPSVSSSSATLSLPPPTPSTSGSEREPSPGPPAYSPHASLSASQSSQSSSASSSAVSPSPLLSASADPVAPSPPTTAAAATTSSSVAASSSSTASTSSSTASSMSFYRLFMSSRSQGPSASEAAREEWERLERGEKGSFKEVGGARTSAIFSGGEAEGDVEEEGEQEDMEDLEEREEREERKDGEEGEEEGEEEGGESVYYSPRKEGEWVEQDEHEYEGGEGEQGEYDGAEGEEEMLARTFLSPIVEVSEPESAANTPFDLASASAPSRRPRPSTSAPLPPQPSFTQSLSASLSSAFLPPPATPARTPARARLSAAPATPLSASKIPRPRNPITPSQNPFLLQLARATTSASSALHGAGGTAENANKAASLLHDLFSTQQDQLATTASQRFLLSSLVTNLQNEVEWKEKMCGNLRMQVEEAREETRGVEEVAIEWERRYEALAVGRAQLGSVEDPDATAKVSLSSASSNPATDKQNLVALEETVSLLADELETRVREDRQHRRALEAELDRLRDELKGRTQECREGEIGLNRAVRGREKAEGEREREREARERAEGEREEIRGAWGREAEERGRTERALREEVERLRTSSSPVVAPAASNADDVDRLTAALIAAQRETDSIKHDLLQRDSTLAQLRTQTRQQRQELETLHLRLEDDGQRSEVDLARLNAALEAKEEELSSLQDAHTALQDEFEDLLSRYTSLETANADFSSSLASKDSLLALQTSEASAALSAMADLSTHVQRLERDLQEREREVERVKGEMEEQRKWGESVVEKREGVLVEAEKREARCRRELEAGRKEWEREKETVRKLRRDSADREVRVTKLKKRMAELEEDVFGLNIALDAKQQEASHWKRQLSTLKHGRERVAASFLADSTSAAVPPSTVSRPAFAPISAVSTSTVRRSTSNLSLSSKPTARQHSTTPHPSEKGVLPSTSSTTTVAASAATTTTARPRASIARRPSVAPSSATETEDEDLEERTTATGLESHDLTLPPNEYEKTPSRPQLAVRRSSSSLGLGQAAKGRSSSGSGGGGSRRSSGSSTREDVGAKENDPTRVQGQGQGQGEGRRRREAVLA